jgi:hypothetical protein
MGNNKSHVETQNTSVFTVPQLMTTTQFHDYVIKNNLDKLPSFSLNMGKNILVEGSDLAILTNIIELDCGINQNITDQFLMSNSETLQILRCGTNKYISDNGIKSLINLRSLYCDGNDRITNDGIKNLVTLELLDVGQNAKLSDDGIINLVNLHSLNCNNMKINENKNIYRFTDNGLRGKHLTYLECCDPTQFSSKLLLDVNPRTLLFNSVHFPQSGPPYYQYAKLLYDGLIKNTREFSKDVSNENKLLSDRGWNFETNQYIQKLIIGGTRIGRKVCYTDNIVYAPIPEIPQNM